MTAEGRFPCDDDRAGAAPLSLYVAQGVALNDMNDAAVETSPDVPADVSPEPRKRTRVGVWKREGLFVYIHCPHCGDTIEEPFSVVGVPIPFQHKRRSRSNNGGEACFARMIVYPDPAGRAHEVELLDHNDQLEDVWETRLRDRETVHRLLTSVYMLTDQEDA